MEAILNHSPNSDLTRADRVRLAALIQRPNVRDTFTVSTLIIRVLSHAITLPCHACPVPTTHHLPSACRDFSGSPCGCTILRSGVSLGKPGRSRSRLALSSSGLSVHPNKCASSISRIGLPGVLPVLWLFCYYVERSHVQFSSLNSSVEHPQELGTLANPSMTLTFRMP